MLNEQDKALLALAVQHLAVHPRSKDGIGIKDPHRWIQNGTKKEPSEPWREWIEDTKPQGGLNVGLNEKDYTAGVW